MAGTQRYVHLAIMGVSRMTYSYPRKRPENEVEFEQEMRHVDNHLYESRFIPAQRPHIFPLRFADAFRDVTLIYPEDALADEHGFEGNKLVAKGHRWYREMYGNRLNHFYELGFSVVELGGALWRFAVPQVFGGRCEYVTDKNLEYFGTDSEGKPLRKGEEVWVIGTPVKINCLACVDELPQGMAIKLSDAQLNDFLQWCRTTVTGISWFVNLFWRVEYGDKRLFYTAFNDYKSSCTNLLQGRFVQSRWDSTQAAEKLMKGILQVLSGSFNTGHNLEKIRKEISNKKIDVRLDKNLLDTIYWPPSGRYAEKPTTPSEALKANHGVLVLACELAANGQLKEKLTNAREALQTRSAPQSSA